MRLEHAFMDSDIKLRLLAEYLYDFEKIMSFHSERYRCIESPLHLRSDMGPTRLIGLRKLSARVGRVVRQGWAARPQERI